MVFGMVFGILFGILLSSSSALATTTIEDKAHFLCDHVFNSGRYKYDEHFSKEFIQALPEAAVRSIAAGIVEATGRCVTPQKIKVTAGSAEYRFVSSTESYAALSFSLDQTGLIDGLRIRNVFLANIVISSWNDAVTQLNSLEGHVSLSIVRFGGAQKELRANDLQPVASGFKLYVLGALADAVSEGRVGWKTEHPLIEKWKSLPSGVMHTWPNGKMVSLYDYAEYMIKISDNTATDHLLHIVGRDKVEAQVKTLKNDFVTENTPFLSTAEMFKLKWAAPLDLIASFIRGSSIQRRDIAERDLASVALDKVGTNGVPLGKPSYIREIEWFGSTNNLCSAMEGLKAKNSLEVMKALSQSVPFLEVGPNSHWKYGGYKGGSEPGVLTMTYLLQSQSGSWGCVSIAWHNENKNLNDWIFFDIASKVLKLSEREI